MAFAHVVPRGRRIGMVRHFAHDETASDEWLPCDGAILDPDEYPALHARLASDGFPFGGDGDGAAVPDLQGRSPMGASASLALGDADGEERVQLTVDEIPSHRHQYGFMDLNSGLIIPHESNPTQVPFLGAVGHWVDDPAYTAAVGNGVSNPHENMQPSLVGRWMIYAGCVAVRGGGVEGPTIGEVRAFATAEDVPGWALCGTPASRADHPWLWAHYAALGYPYGAGDGSTTFGTPPTPGRVLVGDGTGDGLTARVVGDVPGVETHELLHYELGEHYHVLEIPGEYGEVVETGQNGTNSAVAYKGSTSYTGGGDPHNNMAPTVAMVHRVYAGTDPVPDEGFLGVMPNLLLAWAALLGNGGAEGNWLNGPGAGVPVGSLVLFIHDFSASDTWGGLYYWDGGAVEFEGARLAVVEQSSGARIHVCYLTEEQLSLTTWPNGSRILVADIALGGGELLIWHLALVSNAGNAAPTFATSPAASTNPLGPSIAVTDDTIACLSVLGSQGEPVSETATLADGVETYTMYYGSLSATDSVEAGTYAATWNNPESVTACAAVVLIPRRLVP